MSTDGFVGFDFRRKNPDDDVPSASDLDCILVRDHLVVRDLVLGRAPTEPSER